MANVKISQLPAVSSVTGTDVFPVVASTTTSKLSITNLANSLPQVTSSISASLATTASYVLNAVSASFALSASWAPGAGAQTIFPFTGSAIMSGSLQLTGSLFVTGSPVTILSSVYMNPQTLLGDINIPDFTNALILGPYSVSGSINLGTGSSLLVINDFTAFATTGSNNFDGNQTVTGSLIANNLNVKSNLYPFGGFEVLAGTNASSVSIGKYGESGQLVMEVAGDTGLNNYPNFTFYAPTDGISFIPNVTKGVQVTGSLKVSGGITGSLFGTASFAVSASWAPGGTPVVLAVSSSGSSIYSVNPGTSDFGLTESIFLGTDAGGASPNANYSNFLGFSAGRSATNATYSNFFGSGSGYGAYNADNSNFIGANAGKNAGVASNSNFIGAFAGENATNARYSNFIGYQAGAYASIASCSVLLGYQAGTNFGGPGISSNNIVIGTNITLPDNTENSINLGGIIFATGSHSDTSGATFSGAMTTARVGINKVSPVYTLDVNGSGNYASGLTVTGSFVVTGSFIVPAQATANPATGSIYVEPANNRLWVFTGNSATGWVTASLGI